MKISDFLRMKITPENKQFDMIKNIRFLDDKNVVLAGKATTTVTAFCEAFFDYVNRNYRSSRGAEKLIKSNRKKLNRLSGSESMILVQRILEEISNDYAITHFHITCEMAAPVKKPVSPVQPVQAAPQAQQPVQQPVNDQSFLAKAKPFVNAAPVNSAESSKIRVLESELGRLQPEPDKKLAAATQEIAAAVAGQSAAINTVPEVQEEAVQVANDVAANAETNVEANTEIVENTIENATVEVQEEVTPDVSATEVEVAEQVTENAGIEVQEAAEQTEVPVETEDEEETDNTNNPAIQAETPNVNNQNNQNQNNQYQNKKLSKKEKKRQRIAGDLSDARMKPGKGIKPLKDFKEATRFMDAGMTKSKLNLNEIPCIAVIEENKVPTIEEVPCIAVIEDNTVPTMEEVPYVGVEDKPEYLNVIIGEELKKPEATVAKEIPTAPATVVQETPEETVITPAVQKTPVAPVVTPAAAVQETPVAPVITPVAQEMPAATVITPAPAAQDTPVAPVIKAAPVNPAPVQLVTPVQPAPPIQAAPVQPIPVMQTIPPVQPAAPAVSTPAIKPVSINSVKAQPASGIKDKKDIRKQISDAITLNKQVIFVGPSGTGKTYQVRKYVRRMTKGYDGFKFVQFHQSYEYSDFIEGLRPANIVNTSSPTNVRLDGIFKAFCRKIVEDNLENAVPGFSTMYSEKKQKVVQGLYESIRDRKEAIDDGLTNEYFAPGTQEYIFENGVKDYYFIIDEVNRADVSKVFGDVLFVLDEDYRGIENRFDTRLSNLKSYRIVQADDIGKANYSTSHIGFAEQMKFDCFEHGFYIPKNLHIICTMNEIDNSASSMDFSFKRKFNWVNINTEDIMLSSLKEIHKGKAMYWLDRLAENINLVNRLISDGISPEHCLGPAFFRNLNESTYSIDTVFDNTIDPILREYLKGQPADITERFVSECKKALKLGI
ncbi:MAG: AAA family ATPase [Lachnospiraceae bacterium]|nr:AAA family ATPase [Lachnospiraceae bacterium]